MQLYLRMVGMRITCESKDIFVRCNSWLCNVDILHFAALRVTNDAQQFQVKRLHHHCRPVVDRNLQHLTQRVQQPGAKDEVHLDNFLNAHLSKQLRFFLSQTAFSS